MRTTKWTKAMGGAVIAVTIGTLAASCTVDDGSPDESTSTDNEALSSNVKTAYEFFVAKGLKPYQSAGIVGNLMQESSVIPTIYQYGGGPGRGIAQWSAGDRWDHAYHDNAVWYAGTRGESVWSLNLQLEFIWYELNTFGYGFSALKSSGNLTQATHTFMADYEICGQCVETQRLAYAQQVLNAYGSSSPSPSPTPSGGGCVAGGLYCGGDKVSGDSNTLYRCNGSATPTTLGHCSDGCEVISGNNDECRGSGGCYVGGFYCGGDKVAGDPSTLYRCTGGSSGAVVSHCANGCAVESGSDDRCK